MNNYEKIAGYYKKCFAEHGDTPQGLAWPNEEDMDKRFKIMAGVIKPEYVVGDHLLYRELASLLDLGCGTGRFKDHLTWNIKYYGADISENSIEFCKKKYPNIKDKFFQIDVLKTPEKLDFYDYIVMNGIFTVKCDLSFEDMFDFLKKMIEITFAKANKGIAFNVMSKHVDWERDDLFHMPFDVLAKFLCKEVTRNFIFRNDYGLYEYTIYLYK
jgi:SAM-dependent methyltransferase